MKINDPDYRLSNDELAEMILSYSQATADATRVDGAMIVQHTAGVVGVILALRELQRLRQTIAAAQSILDADRGREIEIGASYAVLTTHYSATNEAEVGGAETWFDALAALVKEPPGDGGNHE